MFNLQEKTKTLELNQGQKKAVEGFMEFLFSPERELILSGAAGTGKTHTMSHFIGHAMPEYHKMCSMMGVEPEYDSVVMTATTNKAAEVLGRATNRPTETIHSFLGLTVKDDFSTGKSVLKKTNKWRIHERLIVFIDEAFTIDSTLLSLIREGTHKCKLVFIGDHCQLAPVMETTSPIQRDTEIPFFKLTEPMRNAGQPALMNVSSQLRETVETGVFNPIQIVPGVIDHADDEMMQRLLAETFTQQTREARILCYTNKQVNEYNDYIRGIRNLPDEYERGELLVNVNAVKLGKEMISIEEEIEIIDQEDETISVQVGLHEKTPIFLEVRRSTLRTGLGTRFYKVPLPVNRAHFLELTKWFAQQKQWDRYFSMKNGFPELRPRDAATVHKAQGSTYDVVFIDLNDISSCHQPQTAARLLYVAFTRARFRVVLYGDLASKYGGLTQ